MCTTAATTRKPGKSSRITPPARTGTLACVSTHDSVPEAFRNVLTEILGAT